MSRRANRPVMAQMEAGLKALGDAVYDGGLRKARGAAARVARDAARKTDLFTSRTGALIKAVKVTNARKQGTRLVAAAPHAILVERGRAAPRPSAPRPFLTTAVRTTTGRQLEAAAMAMKKELKRLHRAKIRGNPANRG